MTTLELTKKDILLESLSQLDFSNEPEFFQNLRKDALAELQNLDFPTSKTEYWKYTRLGKIINKKYNSVAGSKISIDQFLIPDIDANIIVLVNGIFDETSSNIKQQEGVKILSLVEAKEKGVIIRDHFNKYTSGKNQIFLSINNAFHTDGVCIHSEKNTIAERPYHIINITTGDNSISLSRNLFIAEANSSVKIIESFVNLNGTENFINNVSEIIVQENAHLEYNKIQNKENENYQISTEQVYQSTNSNFTINTIILDGALIRNNLNIDVNAEGCETNLNGIYLGKNNNHIDNHTIVDHLKPNCNSNQVYKGILDDNSVGVFNGKVFVRRDAQKTNAFQQNNNILLTDDAVVNSKPELEIYADDVKCSHGSTIGQLDNEAIFYLRARGVGKRNAINMMITAFAKDALERVSIAPLKEYIENKIEARFGN